MGKKNIDYGSIIIQDGKKIEFDTLEEACKHLNISQAAFKIRCNQNKTVDNVTYSWKNPASHRARKNRKKGNNFELEVIKKLKEIGYDGCVSSRSESKRTDDNGIDIVDLNKELHINIQCKNTTNLPNYFSLKDKCPIKDKPFAIVWKKSTNDGTKSPGTVVVMDIEEFYKYLELKKQ